MENFRDAELKKWLAEEYEKETEEMEKILFPDGVIPDDGETEEYLGHINHKIGSAEEFAYDIIERIGVQKYRNAVKSMECLTLEELRTICAQVGNMKLVEH